MGRIYYRGTSYVPAFDIGENSHGHPEECLCGNSPECKYDEPNKTYGIICDKCGRDMYSDTISKVLQAWREYTNIRNGKSTPETNSTS
jgi:hypothetical protein